MQQIIVNVSDPDDLLAGFGAGALIRVERDTVEAMTGASEITTVAIVSGKTQYEYWDGTGASTHYYRTRYSKASPSLSTDYSSYSAVFRPGGGIQEYCTEATIKARLSITDTIDDVLLGVIASETNDWLEGKLGFPVGPVLSEERLFDGGHTVYGGRCLPVYPWGVRAITQLRYASSTGGSYTNLASTDYFIRPPSHMRRTGFPGFEIWLADTGSLGVFPTTGYNVIGVTATWGWDAIPGELSGLATRLGVALWRRRSSGSAQFAEAEGLDVVAAEEMTSSDWRTIHKYADLKDLGAA